MNYHYSNNGVIVGAKYEYENGNLFKVYPFDTHSNDYSPTASQTYEYDTLGQLTSVNDFIAGYTYAYKYDTAGNIRKITKWPYFGNNKTVIELSYDDTIWRDRLSSVKVGNTTRNIVYESVGNGFISGNPISYYNGRSYSFTWQNGRQLSTAAVGNTNVSYSYDMSGLRSSKTVNSDTYSYNTINGQVVSQKWGTKTLWFIYDDESQPFALIYQDDANADTAIYYYALNMQGDVVALLNSSGDVEAEYRYDPWGAVTVIPYNNQIGNLNPLRYRGYYYDSETGLYYLQSRYYDPAIGRFINADVFTTTDADGFLSCNMFAYCENDPVNHSDPNGTVTRGISLSLNATCVILGFSWSLGVFWDDKGNFDFQSSSSATGINGYNMGLMDAGIGLTYQKTDRDTVYDLYGPAYAVGASVGSGLYVGGDIITFDPPASPNPRDNGYQITVGYGYGMDIHTTKTYTSPATLVTKSSRSSNANCRNRRSQNSRCRKGLRNDLRQIR